MTYFKNILSPQELKSAYRQLALAYHPDKGGRTEMMQMINNEYHILCNQLHKIPKSLSSVKVGNMVYVNNSKCIVTEVDEDKFKAKSLKTQRETYFSKSTGYAMLNFKFRASICPN